jgi:hypothetical protein
MVRNKVCRQGAWAKAHTGRPLPCPSGNKQGLFPSLGVQLAKATESVFTEFISTIQYETNNFNIPLNT